jgi:hypothetical protein
MSYWIIKVQTSFHGKLIGRKLKSGLIQYK